ncbi:MAG TPA: hypothetical protein VGH79_05990 [Gaiellaceae bacterium]
MILADIVIWLIPVYILGGLVVLFGTLALLGRIQNGKYLRWVLTPLMKVPLFKRWIERGSRAALERSNPELASAMRKLEPHQKHLHDPVRAQKAMSQLSKQERAALLEMQDQQGAMPEEATNRQMRRALEKQRKRTR